jgi:hypothetical protein
MVGFLTILRTIESEVRWGMQDIKMREHSEGFVKGTRTELGNHYLDARREEWSAKFAIDVLGFCQVRVSKKVWNTEKISIQESKDDQRGPSVLLRMMNIVLGVEVQRRRRRRWKTLEAKQVSVKVASEKEYT